MALFYFVFYGGLKFFRALEYLEVEALFAGPQDIGGLLYSESIIHPIYEAIRAIASKLDIQFMFKDFAIILFCVFFYVRDRSDFLGPDNLAIIDEKDGHLGGPQDLFNQLQIGALVFLMILLRVFR